MSIVFYLIGTILVVIGVLWSVAVFGSPVYDGGSTYAGYAMLGKILAAAPGLSTFVAGMLFLAIGTALDALSRIARNTRETTRLLNAQFSAVR